MSSQDKIQRSSLPIPDRPHTGLVTYDARDPATHFPPIRELRPPQGAPNVLVVLLDDVGFGASSAFGGPCHTPNIEKLAASGLKYTRFHTTALCRHDAHTISKRSTNEPRQSFHVVHDNHSRHEWSKK